MRFIVNSLALTRTLDKIFFDLYKNGEVEIDNIEGFIIFRFDNYDVICEKCEIRNHPNKKFDFDSSQWDWLRRALRNVKEQPLSIYIDQYDQINVTLVF